MATTNNSPRKFLWCNEYSKTPPPENCNNQMYLVQNLVPNYVHLPPDYCRQVFLTLFSHVFYLNATSSLRIKDSSSKNDLPSSSPLCTVNTASADTHSALWRGICSSTPKCSSNWIQVTFKILPHPKNQPFINSLGFIHSTNKPLKPDTGGR